jgi:hypothetical protein
MVVQARWLSIGWMGPIDVGIKEQNYVYNPI